MLKERDFVWNVNVLSYVLTEWVINRQRNFSNKYLNNYMGEVALNFIITYICTLYRVVPKWYDEYKKWANPYDTKVELIFCCEYKGECSVFNCQRFSWHGDQYNCWREWRELHQIVIVVITFCSYKEDMIPYEPRSKMRKNNFVLEKSPKLIEATSWTH